MQLPQELEAHTPIINEDSLHNTLNVPNNFLVYSPIALEKAQITPPSENATSEKELLHLEEEESLMLQNILHGKKTFHLLLFHQ
jgi:hypothetical protein